MSSYELHPELAAISAGLPTANSYPQDPYVLKEFIVTHIHPILHKYWGSQLPAGVSI